MKKLLIIIIAISAWANQNNLFAQRADTVKVSFRSDSYGYIPFNIIHNGASYYFKNQEGDTLNNIGYKSIEVLRIPGYSGNWEVGGSDLVVLETEHGYSYSYLDSAAHEMKNWSTSSETFDTIYPTHTSRDVSYTLMKNRKYGALSLNRFLIPAVYDSVPEFIHRKRGYYSKDITSLFYNVDAYYDLWLVQQNGLFGLINKGQEVLPCIYKKDEIIYEGHGVIQLAKKGEAIQLLNYNLDTEIVLTHSDGEPVIATPGIRYEFMTLQHSYYDWDRIIDSTDHLLIGSKLSANAPEAYSRSSNCNQYSEELFVVKTNEYSHIHNYKSDGKQYIVSGFDFVAELEYLKNDKVRITLFNVLTGEKVHSYKLKSISMDLLTNLTRNSGYDQIAIRTDKRNILTSSPMYKGYINTKTMEFSRVNFKGISFGGGILGESLSALFWPFTHPFLIE